LIELLTVIAILGVLAGLLLPTLGKAKAKARQISCLANMKQLGVAFSLFESEHNGALPHSDATSPNKAACWFYAIDPYLLNKAASDTPSDAQKLALVKQDPIWSTFDRAARSDWHTIKMNRKLIGNNGWDPTESISSTDFRTILTVADEVNTVLLFDGRCEEGDPIHKQWYDGWEPYVERRHNGGANVLFVDGRGEWRKEKQQTTGKGLGWQSKGTTLKWWAN
jgi:prepilin-type processing-associated H-X9-DG protein